VVEFRQWCQGVTIALFLPTLTVSNIEIYSRLEIPCSRANVLFTPLRFIAGSKTICFGKISRGDEERTGIETENILGALLVIAATK
jgi:hypothetical protein